MISRDSNIIVCYPAAIGASLARKKGVLLDRLTIAVFFFFSSEDQILFVLCTSQRQMLCLAFAWKCWAHKVVWWLAVIVIRRQNLLSWKTRSNDIVHCVMAIWGCKSMLSSVLSTAFRSARIILYSMVYFKQ